MPHQPIIPAGRWPNLSRTDRNEPQRVEPALAMDASLEDVLGVEGATLAADQLLSNGPVPDRGASSGGRPRRRGGRAGAATARAGRGLCDRLPAGPSGQVGRGGAGAAPGRGGPRGQRAVVGTGASCGDAARGGARAGGPGSRDGAGGGPVAGARGPGDGGRAGVVAGRFAGRRALAGCSGGRGIAGRVSFVRLVGRGGLRRAGAAFDAGGSGL